jgi:hypothetical protein
MANQYITMRVYLKTLKLLRVVAATKGKSMMHVLHYLVKNEAKKLNIRDSND